MKLMTSIKANATVCCDASIIGGVAILGIVVLAQLHFAPKSPSDAVAVVFPPWTSGGRAVATAVAAGASILRLGRFPFVTVVHADDPHYADRVIAEGAWLVLDPEAFGGCLTRRGLRS